MLRQSKRLTRHGREVENAAIALDERTVLTGRIKQNIMQSRRPGDLLTASDVRRVFRDMARRNQ